MRKNICIIPARKGSSGIKNKNIKLVNGKKLILHTFDIAKKIQKYFHIHITTDSEIIFKLAKKYKFNIDELRPKNLSGPNVQTIEVIRYELKKYEKKKIFFDNVLLLQPTVPYRDFKKIIKALKILKTKKKYNSVISIEKVSSYHPFRMKVFKNEYLKNFCSFKKENMKPRQKLPEVFIRSGSIYLTRIKSMKKERSLVSDKCFGLVLNGKETINVDNKLDLILANNYSKYF